MSCSSSSPNISLPPVHEKRPLQGLALRTRFWILLRLSRRISHPANHDAIPRAPGNQWRASTQDDAKNHTTNHVHSLVKGSLLVTGMNKMFFHSVGGSGAISFINAWYANSSLSPQPLFHSFHPASNPSGNFSKHTGSLNEIDWSASIFSDRTFRNLSTSSASFVISFLRTTSMAWETAFFIIFPRIPSWTASITFAANSSLVMSSGTFVLLSSEDIFSSLISKTTIPTRYSHKPFYSHPNPSHWFESLIWLRTWQPRFHVALFGHARAVTSSRNRSRDKTHFGRHVWPTKGPSWIWKFKRMYGKKVVTWYDPWLLIGYCPYQRYWLLLSLKSYRCIKILNSWPFYSLIN